MKFTDACTQFSGKVLFTLMLYHVIETMVYKSPVSPPKLRHVPSGWVGCWVCMGFDILVYLFCFSEKVDSVGHDAQCATPFSDVKEFLNSLQSTLNNSLK